MVVNITGLDLLVIIKISVIIYAKGAFFIFKLTNILSRLNFLITRFTLFYLEFLNIVEEEVVY
jgi:hypothetical protein